MSSADLAAMAAESIKERGTLSDTIEAVLRKAILTGTLEEGAELNQVQLARQFQVSRVPVREALLRLEAQGLVVSLPYRRAVVASFGMDGLVEIFDIRRMLELRGLELAIRNITPEVLSTLRSLVEQMDQTGAHGDWLKANRRFHLTICEASGRSLLCQMLDQLDSRCSVYLHQYSTSVERHVDANDEHRRILAALEHGDLKAAKQQVRRHLDNTLRNLLKTWSQEDAAAKNAKG